MKGGTTPAKFSTAGFTIVEVMIFIVISSILFVSAMNLLSGKQGRTEFSTGLGTLTSQLQSIIGNVTNGDYDLPASVSCASNAAPNQPTVSTVGGTTGSNFGCTYIGEVLAFGIQHGGADETYTTYPIIGDQYKNGQQPLGGVTPPESTSLADAHPYTKAALASSVAMPYGLSVVSIKYVDGSVTQTTGAVGFFTSFSSYSGATSQLSAGAQFIQIAPLPAVPLPDPAVVSKINSLTDSCGTLGYICYNTLGSASAPIQPKTGILLCVKSGTSQQSALLTLGGTGNSTTITPQLFGTVDCT